MAVGLVVALIAIAVALGGCGDDGNGDQTSPAPEVREADYEEIFEKIDAMIAYQNKLPHLVNKPNSKAVAQFRGYRKSIEEWAAANSIDRETEVLCEQAVRLAKRQIALYQKPNDSTLERANASADEFNEAWESWLDSHPWAIK
jgi:hypothetical protein